MACFHGQLGQVYLCGGIPSGSRGVGDALKEVYSHGAWGLACSLQAYSLHPPQRARCVACSGVATYCSPASTYSLRRALVLVARVLARRCVCVRV